jgi:5-methylcytosine-specific restriction endonuclease McrA
MTSHIPAALLRHVRSRAGAVCEYCRLPQESQEATFHVDHIQPRTAGGATSLDNLALACVTCSLRKAARIQVRDPNTRRSVRLFHPRRDSWDDHFGFTPQWRVRGRTPVGRATISALGMNRAAVVAIRQELASIETNPAER